MWSCLVQKTFLDPVTGIPVIYIYEGTGETQQQAVMECRIYASMVEYGTDLQRWQPEDMYFNKEKLRQWISESQIMQFEGMYDNVVKVAYQNAVGFVVSQIGEIFALKKILSREEGVSDDTHSVMGWILEVLTAWNVCAAGLNASMMLQTNYKMVVDKLTELKNGATTMANAPIKEEPNAMPTIYSKKNSYLG